MLRLQELYFTKARILLLMAPFGLSCKESPGVAIELRVGIALLQSQVYICHRRDGTLDLLQKQIGQLQEQTTGWKQRSAATLTKLEVKTLLHHCRRALIAFSSREASSTHTYTHKLGLLEKTCSEHSPVFLRSSCSMFRPKKLP